MEDAKQETVEQEVLSSSDAVDAAFDKLEGETEEEQTSSDSSTEEKAEETETSETEDTSPDDDKSEKSKEEEVEVPKEFHKHPAWQRILKERDEARGKIDELDKKYSSFESKLEEFNKVTSSPAYIKQKMEAEGYKQEAINSKLKELGYNVEEPTTSDIDLITRELNINVENLTDEQKQYLNTQVADAAKVADIIVRDRLSKVLPKELQDVKTALGKISNESKAAQYTKQMKETIESEGVLDFSKDIEPAMVQYLNDNPQATQQDAFNHFKDLSRKLTIEVLQAKGKKKATAESKKSLRQNKEGVTLDPNNAPKREEGDTDSSFVDKVLDWGSVNF